MSDMRTLGEIAARAGMLTVACSRRERRGRYRLDTLPAHASSYLSLLSVRAGTRRNTALCPTPALKQQETAEPPCNPSIDQCHTDHAERACQDRSTKSGTRTAR